MADGTYMDVMERATEHFFAVEPYKTHRAMFNVHAVAAVSESNKFGAGNYNYGTETALGCFLTSGSFMGGRDAVCYDYALKAVDESRMDEALIIVIANATGKRAGTAWPRFPEHATDYGSGAWVCYLSRGLDDFDFKGLVQHEGGGHGFAKLIDEYVATSASAVGAGEKEHQRLYGWWPNVDWTSDPATIRWAAFIADTRYQTGENLLYKVGAHEGAKYTTGAWKPTMTSIMYNNTGKFNAPSREAIYRRIHKLAHGPQWEYSREEFVEYDMSVNFGAQTTTRSAAMAADMVVGAAVATLPEGSPAPLPDINPLTWREELSRWHANPK
jgi:hypothetical protein